MPKSDLSGKTILITGATGGFGREFTRQLLQAGAHVILSGRDASMLDEMAHDYAVAPGESGARVIGSVSADLSDEKGCEALHAGCTALVPDIDVLMYNAGVITYGDFHEVPMARWQQLMEVNLLSAMRLTYLFLPAMLKRRRGHIVLVSSLAGVIATRQSAAYAASKFGMRGFGLSLYGEVHSSGIDVTIILPFWANTPLLRSTDYGSRPTRRVIRALVDSPADVVRESIRGIRRGKLIVYPGHAAKVLAFVNRFVQLIGSQGKGA